MARIKVPPHAPYAPCPYVLADAVAIRAVTAGTANEAQQQRAMAFIINALCRTYDLSYRPESTRDTDFAEGMRHVGLQLVKFINLPLEALKRENA